MLDMKPRKILVGIGEPDDLDGVLEFAAAEAVRRQCGVHLMHAVSAGSRHGDGSELTITGDTMQHAGTDVLVTAAQQLEELLADDLSVTTELVHDGAASALNEASPHACLVLLQRRPHPGITHGVRSVVNGVAGRAAVPVVVVPSTWRRDAERPAVVVVGVGDAEVSGALVGTARDMAEEVGADLRIVHARPEGRRHQSGTASDESRGGRRPAARVRPPADGPSRPPRRVAGRPRCTGGHAGRRRRHRVPGRDRTPPPQARAGPAPRVDGTRRAGPRLLPGDGRGAGLSAATRRAGCSAGGPPVQHHRAQTYRGSRSCPPHRGDPQNSR